MFSKIKLLDADNTVTQGNKSQVQKFKQLVSKEFGKSVSFSEGFKSDAQRKHALCKRLQRER